MIEGLRVFGWALVFCILGLYRGHIGIMEKTWPNYYRGLYKGSVGFFCSMSPYSGRQSDSILEAFRMGSCVVSRAFPPKISSKH